MATKKSTQSKTTEAQEFTPEQKKRLLGLTKELEASLEEYKEDLQKTILQHIRFKPNAPGRKKTSKS
jgi:hypothetical protein